MMGLTWGSVQHEDWYPPRCYFMNDGNAYFNTHPRGTFRNDAHAVCRIEAALPPTQAITSYEYVRYPEKNCDVGGGVGMEKKRMSIEEAELQCNAKQECGGF